MSKTAATATAKWDTVIELRDVSKHFVQRQPVGLFRHRERRVEALTDVSFQGQKGEFIAYAGPNGAGKSTTFKLLAGMLEPQSGEVRVFSMNPATHRIPIMQKTGVLFGNRSELWWDHPVKTSFQWKKEVWAIPDDVYARALSMVTELLDIAPFMDTFARELSLGQRMRANLAMTFLNEPELVLLDEPTLGLDVLAKRQMIDFLKTINRDRGVTILVTSHDMDDLTEMASRILLLNEGKIAFDGRNDELLNRTGERRIVRLSIDGAVPKIDGATHIGDERGYQVYEYNAETTPTAVIMQRIGAIEGVREIETGRASIESVIAELYKSWRNGGA